MKLSTAINYRFKYQMKAGIFFFGYFCLFAIVFPLVGILLSGTSESINSDALISSIIFMIILAFIGINSDFKLFIQNGMSRNNIFLASIISNFILSVCMTVAIMITKTIIGQLLNNFQISFFFVNLYAGKNILETFLLLLVFLLFASSVGSLIGTFNDRTSGFTKLIIIATIIMIPTLLILLLKMVSPEIIRHLIDFLKTILGIDETGFHIIPVFITLLISYLILTIITYLLNIHREVKRVNE